MTSTVDFIETKRDGRPHRPGELAQFALDVRDGRVPDYQLAAWLMAVYFNGLSSDELTELTEALRSSGKVVQLPPGAPVVDKHSTGGVGDKATLIVAPLAAACGLRVAKLSGRGLGFTGGTVDKLESIPGMDLELSDERFVKQVNEIGVAVSGHSSTLAPAEAKFYAMRDVTGTVPSLPLIASSIVSKKTAGGADSFVFDVKCGSGAFMTTPGDARRLAELLISLSASLGRRSSAVISNMAQPLGEWVGNAAEVIESIDVLSGRGPADTRELSIALVAEMLLVAGVANDIVRARDEAAHRLYDGSALRKFAEMIRAQGGDTSVCDDPRRSLVVAPTAQVITSPRDGAIVSMDTHAAGSAIKALGGGRSVKGGEIDRSTAIRFIKKIGEQVCAGEPVAEIYCSSRERLDAAQEHISRIFAFGDAEGADMPPLIIDTVR